MYKDYKKYSKRNKKMIKEQIATLLETEMDRKNFLKTTAVTAIALTGVVSALRTVWTQLPGSSSKTVANARSSAYGDAQYGTPKLS